MDATASPNNISVGVAGWSYPDWNGYVYPKGVGDRLRFVAGFVDVMEINSTFYRPPDARTVASWVKRTEDISGFFFAAKLHQDVTHRGVIAPETVRQFHDGLQPMTAAGKLRHLLAQFRYDFADAPDTRRHLARIKDAFGALANLTLELRHSSWQSADALPFLNRLEVSIANLDYPLGRDSFSMQATGVGRQAYLRLHGRNAAAWFSTGAGRDQTYNYLYSKPELAGIAKRAQDIARMSATLTIVANNHYQGKEMVNAIQLKTMLSGKRGPAPEGLIAAYPDLREYVHGEPDSLL